jgi:hypothetical protein
MSKEGKDRSRSLPDVSPGRDPPRKGLDRYLPGVYDDFHWRIPLWGIARRKKDLLEDASGTEHRKAGGAGLYGEKKERMSA